MKKFVFVMNIPSPYRLHSLGETWRQLKERGIDFHCHFMAKGHADRPKSWLNPKIDFPHTYWFDCGIGQRHFNPGLVWHLCRNPPDVLHLGSPYDTLTCVLLAKFCRAKVISVGLEGNTQTPGRMDGLIGRYKRWVLKEGNYATVPGVEGVRFVGLHQSRTKDKMPTPLIIPNLVDETRFVCVNDELKRQYRYECWGDVGVAKICLVPARFDPVKGLKEFFHQLEPEMLTGWKIVVMGHGPEEQMTMDIVRQKGLEQFVKVIHSVPYDQMPKYYAAADLMLLPSRQDMNPLCVVEALHSGLAIALSDRAGNVEEAIVEGENGWSLPVLDPERYVVKLRDVFSATAEDLQRMGRHSKLVESLFWNSKVAVSKWLDQILVGLE